jgi:hypothetical protein
LEYQSSSSTFSRGSRVPGQLNSQHGCKGVIRAAYIRRDTGKAYASDQVWFLDFLILQNSLGNDISHYLMARHDDTPMIDKETHSLAVANMDWNHIKVGANSNFHYLKK